MISVYTSTISTNIASMEQQTFVGRVYKISSPSTDRVYIGSTKAKVKERFSHHKSAYWRWAQKMDEDARGYCSAFEVLKYGDAEVEELESVLCESKYLLLILESDYIEQYKDVCVNKNRPGAFYKAQNRAYYHKIWYDENREKMKEYRRNYYLTKTKVINSYTDEDMVEWFANMGI